MEEQEVISVRSRGRVDLQGVVLVVAVLLDRARLRQGQGMLRQGKAEAGAGWGRHSLWLSCFQALRQGGSAYKHAHARVKDFQAQQVGPLARQPPIIQSACAPAYKQSANTFLLVMRRRGKA